MKRDQDPLLIEAERLLAAEKPDPAVLARTAKQLYTAGYRRESRKMQQKTAEVTRNEARSLLAETFVAPDRAKRLAKTLQGSSDYTLARRLLSRVLGRTPEDREAVQQLALCTYKDEELAPDERFEKALEILAGIGLRDPDCDDPETLGQGGAVYKRRWMRSGRIEDLHISLHFYRKGWHSNPERDMGYCGVNAAYLLDVLANRARTAGTRESSQAAQAEPFEREANALRADMRRTLADAAAKDESLKKQYWFCITAAEIDFGLENWSSAGEWLGKCRGVEHDEWERQTSALQLVSIAKLRGLVPPNEGPASTWDEPWRALHEFLGDDALGAFESARGKVGLALSGGGFRASLFHLGVLARLAECDALRSVEVLSTVSGGSIVGAHYYLLLRELLRNRPDAELGAPSGKEIYVGVVRDLIDQFCAGVQKNLRVRLFTSLRANLKMVWPFGGYGRSNRMGELYEDHLFASVEDGLQTPRRLEDLLIHPLVSRGGQDDEPDRDETFKPKYSNWRRRTKVPILLLNATSLNSGHGWQFTASWMGEPPGLMGQEVDMNERYRRLYYGQAPTSTLRDYRLGYAVAASAGVPALFEPLVLEGLYPGRTVRLVDGGVHDNQGVAGLLDEGCNLIICSDACGQMEDQVSPASNELSVLMRSQDVLQDRVREAQYQDLAWRLQSNALQGLFFIHLKEELDSDPIDWLRCDDPTQPASRKTATSYGVDRTIQRLLSEMRTDLDTFTEVEACALMASGYLMTTRQLQKLQDVHKASGLPGTWGDFEVNAPQRRDWPFYPMLALVGADPNGSDRRAADLAAQLKISRQLLGKVWFSVPALKVVGAVAGVAALFGLAYWIKANWSKSYGMTVGEISILVVLALIGLLLPMGKYVQRLGGLRRWIYVSALVVAGSLLSHLHLAVFDRLYKRRGRLKRLLELSG